MNTNPAIPSSLTSSAERDVPKTTGDLVSTPSKRARVASYVLSAFAVLFLVFDAGIKLALESHAVEGTQALGYPASVVFPLGLLELVCLVLYLVPRTSVLGAVLWTGYLGGAIATHVRLGNPLFSHTLFPVYVAALLWGALYLRDVRVRALAPWRSTVA